MDWGEIANVANSAVLVTWLTLIGGGAAWLITGLSNRRIKVLGADATSYTVGKDGTRAGHKLLFTVYNNQSLDVGIHGLTIHIRRRGFDRHSVGLAGQLELPETIRAQHSHTIELGLNHLTWSEEHFKNDPDPSLRRYKVEVRLGNGRRVSTRWLAFPAAAYDNTT